MNPLQDLIQFTAIIAGTLLLTLLLAGCDTAGVRVNTPGRTVIETAPDGTVTETRTDGTTVSYRRGTLFQSRSLSGLSFNLDEQGQPAMELGGADSQINAEDLVEAAALIRALRGR